MISTANQPAPESSHQTSSLDERLVRALRPVAAPIAITFRAPGEDVLVASLPGSAPAANQHGRTGQVPAGCVFWIHATEQQFSTRAADHANCSVGSYTHGFLSLEQAAQKDDVAAVLDSGWVSPEAVSTLPHLSETPDAVLYGPLSDCDELPDVVLIRVNGLGLMTLHSAVPDLMVEGKPQCHIIPLAAEQGRVAASVGCALSRARTGMRSDEMTCAIPGRRLAEVVEAIESTVELDRAMARYAAADARRFA